jgi:hypothetical protein
VAKMLAWGHPEKLGSLASRCLHGGQGTPLVARRGQSSLGWRCAQVSGDTWGRQGSQVRHAGGIDRPSIVTVPAMFRTTFDQNAAGVLRAFRRCGAPCLEDFSRTVRGQRLRGGSLTVRPTPGRHGPSHPPRPLRAPSGGVDGPGERWEPLPSVPSALLRRQWPWPLLTMRRQTLQTAAITQGVDACCRKSPDGLVPNVHQGAVPSLYQSGARDVAPDVVSPPSAVRRIDRDDGERVPEHDRSHRTERLEHATVTGDPGIGRMGQPTIPKGFQRLRTDGVQATKTLATVKAGIPAALAKGEGGGKGAVQRRARMPDRQRDAQSTGRDPFQCPHCQPPMDVWRLWHPTSGMIYEEGEVSKRGPYASTAQRAGP